MIITVFFGLTQGYAEAGTNIIEFKKKYVTNSPDVCGDKLCDKESEDTSTPVGINMHTPLKQYNLGIPVYKITCKNHLTFVLKISN